MKTMHKITTTIRRKPAQKPIFSALLGLLLALTLSTASHAADDQPQILIVGDSLSSAYGLNVADGWAQLLQQKLQDQGQPHQVINSSVTGDTSANGRGRLPDLLAQYTPAILILELGGNDGLRGLSIRELRANLLDMVEMAGAAGARTLLVGMQIPTNYGAAYSRMFTESYATIATQTNSNLVPFLLSGFELDPGFFQSDGIHPNEAAQQIMLDNVWQHLEPML